MTDHSKLKKLSKYSISIFVCATTVCLVYLAIDSMMDDMTQAIIKQLEARQSCDTILITAINNATTIATFSDQETSSSIEYVLLKRSELIESCGLKVATPPNDTQ